MSFFSKHKQIITSLVLASLMMFVFWGLMSMTHETNGQMRGDCPPFSAFGASLCSQDGFAAALHHIVSYQSAFGSVAQSGVLALILSMFLALAVFISKEARGIFPIFFRSHAVVFSSSSLHRKVARWLSLFENSPSF